MCGIVGWVAYDRNLVHEQAALRAMTATAALRGPDAEGLWLDRHCGFGHRRLAVIDLAGGVQPMLADEDRQPTVAITYSGEVYNYRELRAELRALGHDFRTDSDTEVVLHAYLEWGEDLAERLNGMYAFGVWDGRQQRLLLVRDRMGVKPLCFHPTPDGVLFASEPKSILAHPDVSAEVDLDGLRELLALVKTPGHGVYRGVHEVRPGHIVVVDRDGTRTRRYWGLSARPHPDDLDTTVHTVRDLLEDIIRRQLIADVPLCTLLSGGLDSSAVTALAALGSRAQGLGPVRSFAVDFVGQTEHFHPDALRPEPDTPYVHEVAKHVGSQHADIVLNSGELTDSLYRTEVMAANDVPTGLGDLYTSLFLLFRAVREHSTVALSGESADEVFGGYRWFHDPAAVNADGFPWLTALPDRSGSAQGLFAPELERALDLHGYRDAAYRQALTEVDHLPDESPAEHRMREISYLHLTRFLQTLLDRKDRMSMAHGLEVRVPYCDHRLVEYVYNTPWSMKAFDGREKSVLRAAVADLLPESVLRRQKSPYPSTQDPVYERTLRQSLTEVVDDPQAPIAELINPPRVRETLAAPLEESGFGMSRRSVELLLGLNLWLRRYPVRLALT
ncbi:asparagine synthase (glutamine-hydrolyzing) [Dactylosporangium sp. AC04546]|uniref:asparagine synthase (glutamine-hydrolyzing) n=1 Tax=Dactylosporangium sp. AC04546 TaxID=2862460 RepID=UPI001EDD8544|nr:asparagine synthase (glutamine-hydrolyzing) [Dactylosporangium sp. AC04546]WVK80687.1 asparagine synthase (glutamine-hydrolyzing) [Dactylosporangium sp. AC04546]